MARLTGIVARTVLIDKAFARIRYHPSVDRYYLSVDRYYLSVDRYYPSVDLLLSSIGATHVPFDVIRISA